MKTRLFLKCVVLSLMVLSTVSCNNHQSKTLKKIIASYPSTGNFQPDEAVSITFTRVPELLKGLPLATKNQIVTFSPTVKGRLFQVAPKTIIFQPESPLSYDKTYSVTVHLDKLFNHPGRKTFHFQLKTVPLEITLAFSNIIPYRTRKQALAKVTGLIRASGSLNAETLKKAFTIKQGDKKLPVTLTALDNKSYRFAADSIERSSKQETVTALLDGKMLGAKTTIIKTFTIPPASLFSFLQYNLVEKPQPHLELTFSDMLSSDQNLDGLVYFQDGTKADISVYNNNIKIFPKTQLDGNHKIVINKSIRNSSGQNLDKDYVIEPYFKEAPPAVRFIGKGNILTGNKKWIIPFEAMNLQAVDVVVFKIYANNVHQFLQDNDLENTENWSLKRVGEFVYHKKIILTGKDHPADNKWKSYAIDLSKMVQADPGAIYRIGLRFRKAYSLLDCTKKNTAGDFSDSTAYYTQSYYYPKDYRWTQRNDPCDGSYYYSDRFKTKSFLATNIGLTVKNSGEYQYKVFTRDLISAAPLSRVRLTFYSFQSQKLAETTSNNKGEATATMKKKPFLLVAQMDNQFAYLKLSGGNALSYSKFNTKGIKPKNGLKGIIFGERGVWRPGDTLFLTFVLQDKLKTLPADYPVKMTVFDARNKKVYTKTTIQGINDFYVFRVPTRQDAPTGVWRAVVTLGNGRFTKNLRVETVLPNRLKINMTANGSRFTPKSDRMLTLSSKWLTGGLASGLKAQVTESIASKRTTFKGYKNFVFDDPAKYFEPDEKQVFNGRLSNAGLTRFKVELPASSGLPGMINLTFVTKVFEAGGRFSIDQKSFPYVPFSTFVGIRAPETGVKGYIETGKNQKFTVVTVDDNGHKVSAGRLKVDVYKLSWSWWYNSSSNNLASYISRHYKDLVFTKTIKTEKGKGAFYFNVKNRQWGRYFVRVTDLNGGHSTGMVVYFDWPYGRSNRSSGDATLLSLSTDKPKYSMGDEVTINFPSPAGARALISLEKNNRIIKTWWVETQGEKTVLKFKATKEMTPNIYAFVSVIQPHLQTKNDLPIRSYGVVPVMVEDSTTFLKPVLSMPDKIRPKSNYTIKVSEAGGRKMTYVLAVVDEGLLDLTHFKTPSLHDFFYKKEALAVNTWDYYNDVIGAYGGRLLQVFAIGGGNSVRELSRKKLNRFKPVVTFLGPFTLKKGSSGQIHHLKMPNYMGSVRVMVIAGNKGAYGSAEKSVAVKQPLMVLASMPRTLVPGETLKLPVTVFAMDDNIKKVRLQLKTNNLFIIDKPQEVINFTHSGQKIAYSEVKVARREGIGKALITVTSGNEKATYNIQIAIRNPNQRVYHTETFPLKAGKTLKTTPQFMAEATGTSLALTVSKIPPVNLQKRLNYLLHYPYGCVEQTVSSVFPQLYLNKLTSLSGKQQAEIEVNITKAIQRLSAFQTYSGGFSYWPVGNYPDDFGTSYTGHFLLSAKEAGYYVSADMLNSWLVYQQKAADDWNEKPDRYGRYRHDLSQAYRLYTLALAGKPAMSAMNRMREMNHLSNAAILRLAAAYALINEKSTAKELIRGVLWTVPGEPRYWADDYGSQVRDEAMAMETFLLTDNRATAFDIFKVITKALGSNRWMSTQTTAFALRAVADFVGKDRNQGPFTFSYRYGRKKVTEKYDKPVFALQTAPLPGKALAISNTSGQMLFVNVETSAIPLPGKTVNEQQNLNLKVTYYNMDGKQIKTTRLPQGKDFYVKIEASNPSLVNYDNLALQFIVPSGWEILNTRMLDLGNDLKSSPFDYLDIRDDRVNVFFSLKYKQAKWFYVLLNASYPGNYFMSPVSCQAMYNHTVHAFTGGGTVQVGN